MRKKPVDIIVGIPSFNEAENIGFVTEQVSTGLKEYFPAKSSLIVNVDANSTDGTREAFLGTQTKVSKCYLCSPKGVSGKGNMFKLLFRLSQNLKAKAIVVVDADLKSITPEWVKLFVAPIYDGYDFVVAAYSRHRYDATITNHICYPVVYGLFGKDIRQPIAGDFAFSGRLNSYFLKRRWHESTKQFGIDVFMTCNAIFGNFKICSAFLGKKVHRPSQPRLGAMFTQVVRTLFLYSMKRLSHWKQVKQVDELVEYGCPHPIKPPRLRINLRRIKSISYERFDEFRYLIQGYLPKPLFNKLDVMYLRKELEIDHRLWADIVYALMAAYSTTMDKGEVVECLKALYFGRVASFAEATQSLSDEEVEREIRVQAQYFHSKRAKLIRKLERVKSLKQK